jgi:glycosyltransferase involved in cell wall biosynthesis
VHRQYYPDVISGPLVGTRWKRVREVLLFLLIPVVLARLGLLILRFRPDVINAHYLSYPTAYVLVVARLLRRPLVLSFHGSDLTGVPHSSRHDVILHAALRLSQGYTVCSNSLLRCLQSSLDPSRRERAAVIHNGVDAQPPAAETPTVPEPFVFVSSRLVETKGVRVAIEAAAILRERGHPVSVVVAGDGPQRSQLEQLARDRDISSSVTFLGSVPHAVSRTLAARSLLVVLATYREGFGMVALEAMMAEKPVVASNSGGLPEILVDGQTGLLEPPGDAAAFADGIQALLADPERAAAMGRRGRERAERLFTWSHTVDGYLAAYSRVLDAASAPHQQPAGTGA